MYRSAALVVAAGLVVFLGACGDVSTEAAQIDAPADAARAPEERRAPVTVLVLEAADVVDRATYAADLAPLRRAEIAAEIAGPVRRVHVDAGEQVQRGQVLIEIDTQALEQELAEAEAVERQRQTRFERAEKLLERKSITRQQFLDALTERDVAAARLATAELRLERARPKAPWTGEVAERRVEEGDYVRPGQPIVELLDVSRLEVRAAAPASDVPYLRTGLPVEVRVDVAPDRAFVGEITRLGTALDAAARTLEVVAEIDPAGTPLRPGLAARLSVPRRTLEQALVIPLDALVEMGEVETVEAAEGSVGGRDAVYVVGEDDRAERRRVRVGPILGADGVVVEAGLRAGERLIVEGQERVSPGQAVEVRQP